MRRLLGTLGLLFFFPLAVVAAEGDNKPAEKIKEIAGTAEFLRSVPKQFAILKNIDRKQNRVTLLLDGETTAKEWSVVADAEVKLYGWWARLDQLTVGDRYWIWFQLDRVKQPVGISMICDEVSEQEMHTMGMIVESHSADVIAFKATKKKTVTLKLDKPEFLRGKDKAKLDTIKDGEKLYAQTQGEKVKLLLDPDAFEMRRLQQKATLRKRWLDEGLPATVTFLHQFGGEMDLVLDHETMRWARSLKTGDKLLIQASPPIEGAVKKVTPWRERTQVRLVVRGYDQGDLINGQRILVRMTPPTAEVEASQFPPDMDRPRTKEERIEWFLASIYCTCGVGGDGCTGHFYTLASCNPNACAMPNFVREHLAEKIEKGKNDKAIFEELLKEQGPDLLRPHLIP